MTGDAGPDGGGDAGPFGRLLEVQDHDTAIDQMRHRRERMPERAELADVERRLSALEIRTKDVRGERDELGARQSALESQIESAKTRRAELEKRMFSGQVAASRDLKAMDDEVRHLARHISELEDREIEVMESLEPLDGTLQAADIERDALENTGARLRQTIGETESAIDADVAAQTRERAAAARAVPGDLLNRYEQLRKKLGGTGAARLVGASCGGCHLVLPAMEVDRIRKAPPDAVITCDQCGRILVR